MENLKTSYRIFKKDSLVEFVRISPSNLDNYSTFILNNLKEREKKCNKNGYIHKILKIDNIGEGVIYEGDFSGDVIFEVKFEALVCSPKVNDIIECNVLQLSTFQSDIIAQQGPLFIVVIFDKIKDKGSLKQGDKILVKIVATRHVYGMPILKVVSTFVKKIDQTKDALESLFVDDFDFIEQE
jgi:DNA-directed RNA polymerase subunit E'/Rpb7